MTRSRLTVSRALVEPTHMRVAGGEEAVSPRLARVVVYRKAQHWQCLIEAPTAEMRNADIRRQTSNPRSGIEAPRGFEVLDRNVGLTRPDPERAADAPSACRTRIQRKCTINERHHGSDVFAEIG